MIESRNSNEPASARRGSHRGLRDGAWRDRRRRDVTDAAPDRTIYARARRGQSGRARTHRKRGVRRRSSRAGRLRRGGRPLLLPHSRRSEEHTSELQSHSDLVCRLLLEKKKKKIIIDLTII